MKKTDISKFGAWMVAASMLLALAACSDEKTPETTTGGNPVPVAVESIIMDPKVAAPTDTLLCTAVVTSSGLNEGDFPVYEWSANGGNFLETNKQSARWVAPGGVGTFTITVKVTNDANSATNKTVVFVAGGQNLVTDSAGQVDLIGTGPDFHYLRTLNPDLGVDVSKVVGGAASDALPPARSDNHNVAYMLGGMREAHSADSDSVEGHIGGALVKPRNIWVNDFTAGTVKRITIDGAKPSDSKRNVYDYPSFSPNGEVVAYQRLAQSWDHVAPDSFHVYIFDLVALKRTKVTYPYVFPRGFFPTFSTDGKWLVYVLDTNKTGQWELYGSPMTGNDVDGSTASLVRMTNTGGAIVSGAPENLRKPMMTWNSVSPVLAIVAADHTLYLVETTATGSNVIPVTEVPRPTEIAWSPDGSLLAASYASGGADSRATIATITPSGAVTDRVVALAGDALRDMAFSPDAKWMVYRVTRSGSSWFEVVDIAAGKLAGPIPVTPVDPVGSANTYRNTMLLQPAWTSANQMIYPSWGTSNDGTPGISTRDLSGLNN